MKTTKKVITMLMLDSSANGCTKVEIKNWTGIAYKVSKEKLNEYIDRDDFKKNGVYFLFGDNSVYIGQAGTRQGEAEAIDARLVEHCKDHLKEFWSDAVFFVTKEDDFGPTDLNFLENRFYVMAKAANSYDIKNKVTPNPGNTTEAKEVELEEFSDNAEMILGLLGYKVFEKKILKVAPTDNIGVNIPPLPNAALKVGEFVRTAMKNLAESGYVFTDENLALMESVEWSKETMRIRYGFIRKCTGKETSTRDEKGYLRFWSNVFTFGNTEVLVSSQWYDTPNANANRDKFIEWYNSLK